MKLCQGNYSHLFAYVYVSYLSSSESLNGSLLFENILHLKQNKKPTTQMLLQLH